MINQKNREEIINLLEKSKEKVSMEDLFLFDLSPYYNEKMNDSFFSKQIEFIQEKNRLNHNPTISFASEQSNIYNGIIANKRSIISAPTSFGKTMLVKEYIFNFQPNRVVFITPTNSLSDELIENFNELFTNLGYTIYDTVKENSKIPEKCIFVGTQEKFYQIYQNRLIEIDLFVIDEAYKLSDEINGSREVILNRTFIDITNNAKRTILLLPLVYSIEGLESLNFTVLKSEFAPVVKNFIKLEDNQFHEEIQKKIKRKEECNLIYFDSPNKAEDYYLEKLNNVLDIGILSDEWIERIESDFHKDWIPINAIRNGIGIHYGPMPKFIQKKVVDLFNSEKIKTILATSSIIEGVNTPTKNIFITTSSKIFGNKYIIKFKNLIGRAGRLGIHKVGNIYFRGIHEDHFNLVNIPFSDIKLKIIIDSTAQVVEINRELEYNSLNSHSNNKIENNNFETSRPQTINSLNEFDFGEIPAEKLSEILNKHGYTINQVKTIINYSKNEKINIFGILGKLSASDTYINSINIILDNRLVTVTDILNELIKYNKFKHMKNSQLVSIIIKMIYNIIPHKIIPALDFIIELNEIFLEYNKRALFSRSNIREANLKKVSFFNKFIGEEVVKIEESKRVMSKLFEYGIPYFRVKSHINRIVEKVPDCFSIYDIKRVIFEDITMYELRVYFE